MRCSGALLTCAYLLRGVYGTCYFPNGTAVTDGNQTPCNDVSAMQSMCCHLRNTIIPDHCRSDGLCIPPDNSNLWRGACTDPTWKDPACLNLCVIGQDSDGSPLASIFLSLTTCADGCLCCETSAGSAKCCTEGNGVVLENGTIVSSHNATPVSISTITASPPPKSNSTSSNFRTIVGGVGGGVAGVVALGLVFWFFLIRRNSRQRGLPRSYERGRTSYHPGIHELRDEPKEVAGGDPRPELDSPGGHL